MSRLSLFLQVTVVALILISSVPVAQRASSNGVPIQHVVVIVQENHSFDNYFGTYPDANGLPPGVALPAKPNGTASVKPFPLNNDVPPRDICHSWGCAHAEFDGGKMDGFVYTAASVMTMGYFDYHQIPYYWDYASQYVLMDNYFSSVAGPSLPNHLYLVAGQSGGIVTNDRPTRLGFPSIFDELQTSGVSWRYYAQLYASGWNPLPIFKSFVPNASLTKGMQDLVVGLVDQIMRSQYWRSTAVFITWDDYGGWYDHVPPPQVDKYGYGFRVPCLIISPYAKRGFIDPTLADHSSILKFIETLFNLQPIAARDAAASNLMEAFDFSQKARAPLILPGSYLPEHYPLTPLTSPPNTGKAAADAKATGSTILSTSQPISGGDLESSLVLAVVVLGVVAALRRFGRWRW
ncbi:MAG: alkaline phosphatase family protein [Thaumarchaeota archaeon]|nr:MAG: alkaline phosphatase family protein [Nitrososphaerota archaeon]